MRIPVPKGKTAAKRSLESYGDVYVYVYHNLEDGNYSPKTIPILQWELESILKEALIDSRSVIVEVLRIFCMGIEHRFELVSY